MSGSPDYVFTRDYIDNNRINLQHYLWVETFGYLLHPSIQTENPSLRVADIGTGTGIWLISLARQLPPTVQLDGLDVSFNATPPQAWLPQNIAFHDWDVTKEVPEHLVGVYDIVHIRNFIFVLQDDQIIDVLNNLIRLLSTSHPRPLHSIFDSIQDPSWLEVFREKADSRGCTEPGGYLQWAEPDVASFRVEKTRPENKISASLALLKLSQGQDARLSPTWASRLAQIFTLPSAKLRDIVCDVKEMSPDMGFMMHECNLPIHELVAQMTSNKVVEEGISNLMPDVVAESKNGAMWAFTRYTVLGRKA